MNHTNQYQVKITLNKKLKYSYISVDKDKNVFIKTPNTSKTFIDSLLKERSAWIEKQFLKLEKTTLIGTEVLYSKDFLRQRVEYFSQKMKLNFQELKFRKMKSRWGSCNSKKVITLNSELLKLKIELIDYVIVHELSHLVHMNHSREFHDLVDSFLPDSKIFRQELKEIRLS